MNINLRPSGDSQVTGRTSGVLINVPSAFNCIGSRRTAVREMGMKPLCPVIGLLLELGRLSGHENRVTLISWIRGIRAARR